MRRPRRIAVAAMLVAVATARIASAQARGADDVRARVLLLETTFANGDGDQGAGLVVGTQGTALLIVTAAHVVQDRQGTFASPRITVPWGTRESVEGAQLVDADTGLDLAVLQVDAPSLAQTLSALPKLCYRGPRDSEPVTTIGHRLGELWAISPGDRVLSTQTGDARRFTITSGGVAPGSSGGPVVGDDGCLLGIVSDRDANEARALTVAQALAVLGQRGMSASLLGGNSTTDQEKRFETFQAVGMRVNAYLFALESIPALLRRSKLDGDEVRQTVEAYNRDYNELYNGRDGTAAEIAGRFGLRRGEEYAALVKRMDDVHKTIVYSRLNDVITALRVDGKLSKNEAKDLQQALAAMDKAIPPLRAAADKFIDTLRPLVSSLVP